MQKTQKKKIPYQKNIKKEISRKPKKSKPNIKISEIYDIVFQKNQHKIKEIPLSPYLDKLYITATGDIIPHGAVKKTGIINLSGEKQEPSFKYITRQVKTIILDSDIAFANLETPYKPDKQENTYRSIPYKFNIPLAMLKEMKNTGFNIFSIANNHLYDQGIKGIVSTVEILKKLGLKFVGAGRNYNEATKPIIIQRKGFKIGFLAFTTWINNDKNSYIPTDKTKQNKNAPYLNRYYDDIATRSIKDLKKKVDFVIVSMHWGHEYHKSPSYEQKRKAKIMIKAGADLILGHHPHVLQPIVYKKGSWIVYSMGNFISNQFFEVKNRHSKSKDSNREGIIYEINLIKKNGKTEIKEIILHPLYLKREFLKNNPDKLKEPYKIYISALKPHEKKYKDIIKFIGPPKIYPEYLKNLSEKIIKYILVLQRKYYVDQR